MYSVFFRGKQRCVVVILPLLPYAFPQSEKTLVSRILIAEAVLCNWRRCRTNHSSFLLSSPRRCSSLVMAGHNKRSRQQKAANKERRAERYHPQSRGGYSHSKPKGPHKREPSYLSNRTHSNQNHARKHTFDDVDPLDRQLFDYLIVVDVEATCERGQKHYEHEVIELPGILVDVRKGLVDRKRSFHTYVKPWRNPILTPFCTELTGITQDKVDNAPSMPQAIKLFEKWYRETIPKGAKVVFAADGPWDFKKFLYEHHVLRDHISLPTLFYEYLDIRTTFSRVFNNGVPIKLGAMLHRMNLRFEGRQHCGFDDAYNIARLAVAMMRVGCVLDFLLAIPLVDEFHYSFQGYPVYRREEGSGPVDGDTVTDIAKACFGEDFFRFGERHRAETLKYRADNPSQFANHNAVKLKRRAQRSKLRRRALFVRYAAGIIFLLLCACLFAYAMLCKYAHQTV